MKCFIALFFLFASFAFQYANAIGHADSIVAQAAKLTQHGEFARSMLMLDKLLEEGASSDSLSLWKANALKANGLNHFSMGNPVKALSCYIDAERIARKLDATQLQSELYNDIFSIYYSRQEYGRAHDLLTAAISLNRANRDSVNLCKNYNNLGLVYYEEGHYGNAIVEMQRALLWAGSNNGYKALIYTNIAEVYYKQGMLVKAEQELELALDLQKDASESNIMSFQPLLNYMLVKARLGKRREVRLLQQRVASLIGKIPPRRLPDAYMQLAETEFALGDSLRGLRYILAYEAINDSLNKVTGRTNLQQLLVAYDTQRLEQRNETLRLAVKNRNIIVLSCVIIAVILVAFVVFLFRRMKSDRRKNKIIMQQSERLRVFEKEQHERQQRELTLEIDRKNRQLTSYTLDMASVSEFHMKIHQELESAKRLGKPNNRESVAILNGVLHDLEHYSLQTVKEDFRTYFDEVHPDFIKKLSLKHPVLTTNDLRLCAFLHLGLTTKEIAALTFREVRSVESSRNRLRKKLGIDAETNLQEFLRNTIC